MDAAGTVADGLSGASLVAVVIIGRMTVRVTKRATEATGRSAVATEKSAAATEQSVQATERSAIATEQSVKATDEFLNIARRESWEHQCNGVLELLVAMRALFNKTHSDRPGQYHLSESHLAGLELMRRLEARLVLLALIVFIEIG